MPSEASLPPSLYPFLAYYYARDTRSLWSLPPLGRAEAGKIHVQQHIRPSEFDQLASPIPLYL